jgi:transcriptional regulator with XRE-family HTH domain
MNRDAFAAMISGIEANGVPRPEIARRTGLSKNTIWRLANGEAREPKYETVQKVLDLKMRTDRLLPAPSTKF